MHPPPTLETERLVLTALSPADADDMAVVLGDPRMYDFTGGTVPTVAQLRERYRYLERGRSPDGREWWLNWVIRPTGGTTAVGSVQATVDPTRARVAWEVGVPWQGQGFATEAATAMVGWLDSAGVGTIEATILPGHGASERVAVKLGLATTRTVEDGERVWRRGDVTARRSTPPPPAD